MRARRTSPRPLRALDFGHDQVVVLQRSGRPGPAPTDAWSFYEGLGERSRSALTPTQAEVAAICDLRQEVNSGGFDSYLRYWGGNSAPLAFAVLPQVLGSEWAEVLAEAMAILGPEYPMDAETRERLLDELEPDDALEALDDRFYELEASSNADARTSAHLLRPT